MLWGERAWESADWRQGNLSLETQWWCGWRVVTVGRGCDLTLIWEVAIARIWSLTGVGNEGEVGHRMTAES